MSGQHADERHPLVTVALMAAAALSMLIAVAVAAWILVVFGWRITAWIVEGWPW